MLVCCNDLPYTAGYNDIVTVSVCVCHTFSVNTVVQEDNVDGAQYVRH